MKRGAVGVAVVAVVAILGVSVWMLQRNRGSDEVASVAGSSPSVEPEPLAPMLPVAADAGRSTSLVPESSETRTPATEQVAAPVVSTLRVTVVDERSAPIADARVVLKSAWGKVPNALVTGADGVASVTAAPESEVDISARHPDFRFNSLHAVMPAAGAPPGEATIVLAEELSACVRVEDERGRSIEGAQISFREIRSDDLRIGLIATPDEITWMDWNDTFKGIFQETRTTGADGRCCVAGITSGPVLIDARASGYLWAAHRKYQVGPRGGDIGVLTLTPARVLHGTVVDAQGPVPDAVVETNTGGRDTGGYVRVVSDADGQFTLDCLQPKAPRIPLLVSHPTRGDFFDENFTLPPDAATITLRPSFDLTLLPRDATTKAAVAGPCTVTRFIPFRAYSIRSGQPRKVPMENGAAHVGWFPYYATGLQLEVPGYARTVVDPATIEAAGGAPVVVDLVRTGTLAIRVIDGSTGLPVVGAKFGVRYAGPSPAGPSDRSTSRSFQVNAPFDEAAGAYILDTSVFMFVPGADETLFASGPDDKSGGVVPVSVNGVRVCGDAVQLMLQPLQATSSPK